MSGGQPATLCRKTSFAGARKRLLLAAGGLRSPPSGQQTLLFVAAMGFTIPRVSLTRITVK